MSNVVKNINIFEAIDLVKEYLDYQAYYYSIIKVEYREDKKDYKFDIIETLSGGEDKFSLYVNERSNGDILNEYNLAVNREQFVFEK